MKILSICIPSYNRFEALKETITCILEAESRDFEIVVIDNCSPRNIEDYICFRDERVRMVKRSQPVYGAKNVGDSILFGSGKYSLLLLDKDRINGGELDAFVECLKKVEIYGGYCELNSQNNVVEIIEKGTIEKFGYLSKHPSGNFYRMDQLKDYVYSKNEKLEKDPFPFDIYLAYCASLGAMMHYDKGMVYSSLNDPKAEDTGSLTFHKDIGNLYYYPKNRNEEFAIYVSCLSELEIGKSQKCEVLLELYKRTISQVSIGYRDTMKNPVVCRHYGHNMKNVSVTDMVKNVFALRKVFKQVQCAGISNRDKRKIEFLIFCKLLYKFWGHRRG